MSDSDDRLDPETYHGLGHLGWRLPRTEEEVKAAEEWAAKAPIELPHRLQDVPSVERSPRALDDDLSRALREEDERRHALEDQMRDHGRPSEDRDR